MASQGNKVTKGNQKAGLKGGKQDGASRKPGATKTTAASASSKRAGGPARTEKYDSGKQTQR